jgi:hypothetical protein
MLRALNESVSHRLSIEESTALRPSRRRFVMRFAGLTIFALLAIFFAGCSLKQGLADARVTESAIKTELGVDASVSFRTFSGSGGTKHFVAVHLQSMPAGDAAAIKTQVTDIVRRSFHVHVDRVDVSI